MVSLQKLNFLCDVERKMKSHFDADGLNNLLSEFIYRAWPSPFYFVSGRK